VPQSGKVRIGLGTHSTHSLILPCSKYQRWGMTRPTDGMDVARCAPRPCDETRLRISCDSCCGRIRQLPMTERESESGTRFARLYSRAEMNDDIVSDSTSSIDSLGLNPSPSTYLLIPTHISRFLIHVSSGQTNPRASFFLHFTIIPPRLNALSGLTA